MQTLSMHQTQHLLATGSDDSLRSEVYTTALLGQLDRLLNRPLGELLTPAIPDAELIERFVRSGGPELALELEREGYKELAA